jgi:hypothetical protein
METIQEAAVAIQAEWGIEMPLLFSEKEILAMITKRVIELLEQTPEQFLQLMYRLDISETKLHGVLQEADEAKQIARLIYDRQMQKIVSRKMHKAATPPDEDADLKW